MSSHPRQRPQEAPSVSSIDVAIPVHPLTVTIASAAVEVAVVSLGFTPQAIQVSSYQFPESPAAAVAPPPIAAPAASSPRPAFRRHTRFRPSGDLVKLEDRLYYMLQPALEVLISEGALSFPAAPFPYQLEGIAFLYPRSAAILADEMGLGKTMQAIVAIRLLLHAGEIRSALLVCPKPLVTNWQREFTRWAPEIPLAIVEGEQAKRRWQWELPQTPVKIANYEVLHRDRELIEQPGFHFDLVVLDEAQRIKNRASATSQTVREIPRGRSWALTGTPIENSPEDLVSIFDFLAPGYLHRDMKLRSMGRAAGQYVLRRTKEEVLSDLPPKLFRDAEVELTPEQRLTYTRAEEEGVLRLTELGEEATIQHVFELVLRLKQICNFDPATGESAKLERLAADLEEVAASGQKAIVFSQWVETITTLASRLERYRPLEYHGRVRSGLRDEVIRQFEQDRRRHLLLMSYGAGSVGLNLQFAQYVFLFDRWWNPAVEDQAIGRAHRIGVAGPVTVTRFLALSTIEQRIQQVLEQKREIFDAIFAGAQPHRSLGLTQQEIFGLFQLRSPQGPIDQAA